MAWEYGDVRALAAWIDSDGSIIIARRRHREMRSGYSYQATVRVYGSDRRPLDWLAETFGGWVVPHNGKARLGKRPAFYWTAGAGIIDAVLEAVAPYLMVHGERAASAQELRRLKGVSGADGRKAAIWARHVRQPRR